MKNAVYNSEQAYDDFEVVWKKFQPYSAHLELLKTNLCIVINEAKLMTLPYHKFQHNEKLQVYHKFRYIGHADTPTLNSIPIFLIIWYNEHPYCTRL